MKKYGALLILCVLCFWQKARSSSDGWNTSSGVNIIAVSTTSSPLAPVYGGTGANWSAVTIGRIPYFSGTGSLSTLAAGTSGKVLQANGAAAPTWVNAVTLTGNFQAANVTATGALAVTGNSTHSGTGSFNGLLTAKGGVTSTGTIAGASLTSTGATTVNGLLTGKGGVTSTGTIAGASLTATGAITANGLITGKGGFTSTGTVTAATLTMGSRNQVVAYKPIFSSTEPASGKSVASATYVGIATVTVTLDGSRPLRFETCMQIVNGAGGARVYTIALAKDGVALHEHAVTNSGTSDSSPSMFMFTASDTSGSHSYSVWVKSSNATGTQTVSDNHTLLTEY